MHRRAFVASAGLVLTAGCVGSIGSTPTPTVSPTPEPRPEVLLVNLVNDWQSYGDVEAEAREYTYRGDVATVGFRARVPVHDGTVSVLQQVIIRRTDTGSRVEDDQYEYEELVGDERDWMTYETAGDYDTTDWTPAEYEIEVTLRDEPTGLTSEPSTRTFTLRH